MIRRCTGSRGEPGWQADIDGVLSECFVYDPSDPLSKIRAGMAVTKLHEEADARATRPHEADAPHVAAAAPGSAWWVRLVVVPLAVVAALVLMAMVAGWMDDPAPRGSPGEQREPCYDQSGPAGC
jgi:hypothetical protein